MEGAKENVSEWFVKLCVAVFEWINDVLISVLGIDLRVSIGQYIDTGWLTFAVDNAAWWNDLIPIGDGLLMIAGTFVTMAGIRIVRYIVGWIPGPEG